MGSYSQAVRTAQEYYNSEDADTFYATIWGGEDIHIGLYESEDEPIADASVVAGMVNTRHLEEAGATDAVATYASAIDAPATDPVRFGVPDDVLDAIL